MPPGVHKGHYLSSHLNFPRTFSLKRRGARIPRCRCIFQNINACFLPHSIVLHLNVRMHGQQESGVMLALSGANNEQRHQTNGQCFRVITVRFRAKREVCKERSCRRALMYSSQSSIKTHHSFPRLILETNQRRNRSLTDLISRISLCVRSFVVCLLMVGAHCHSISRFFWL